VNIPPNVRQNENEKYWADFCSVVGLCHTGLKFSPTKGGHFKKGNVQSCRHFILPLSLYLFPNTHEASSQEQFYKRKSAQCLAKLETGGFYQNKGSYTAFIGGLDLLLNSSFQFKIQNSN
jgi:hypothetical protein